MIIVEEQGQVMKGHTKLGRHAGEMMPEKTILQAGIADSERDITPDHSNFESGAAVEAEAK
jgi:hypothetical protein